VVADIGRVKKAKFASKFNDVKSRESVQRVLWASVWLRSWNHSV